jgi:hypothetical protein
MFNRTTKILVAALVLAGASLTLVTDGFAAPTKAPTHGEQLWMDRASNADTNGF